ncbi:MAG: hypothetical protein HRU70_07235 [Phycisphaeraceae bacterium]|nr:MAG: hypothetical protein HRU70_07235 [Phycisphaeraceae bacterium]
MPKRQVVLMKAGGPKGEPAPPLGTHRDVRDALARFNTAPDGAVRSKAAGTEVLHGPGMLVEIPTTTDTVQQAMVTMTDDDIAWPVLERLCRGLQWKMVDLETGRAFG